MDLPAERAAPAPRALPRKAPRAPRKRTASWRSARRCRAPGPRKLSRAPLFQMLAQESHRARPGVLRRLEVGARAVVLGPQETVAGAVVDMGLVGLPELLHLGLGRADGGDHPRVVAAIEAQHGGLDAGEVRGLG